MVQAMHDFWKVRACVWELILILVGIIMGLSNVNGMYDGPCIYVVLEHVCMIYFSIYNLSQWFPAEKHVESIAVGTNFHCFKYCTVVLCCNDS